MLLLITVLIKDVSILAASLGYLLGSVAYLVAELLWVTCYGKRLVDHMLGTNVVFQHSLKRSA